MTLIRSPKNVLTGLLFLVIAAWFASESLKLPIGSAIEMGPGYFPLILCALLTIFGLVTIASGLRIDGEAPKSVAWRGLSLLTGAAIFFGATAERLGFLPSLAGALLIATLAEKPFRPLQAVVKVAIITALCWAIFIYFLRLPLPLFGPWFETA